MESGSFFSFFLFFLLLAYAKAVICAAQPEHDCAEQSISAEEGDRDGRRVPPGEINQSRILRTRFFLLQARVAVVQRG